MSRLDSLNIKHPITKPGTELLFPQGQSIFRDAIQKIMGGSVQYNPVTGYFESPSSIKNKTAVLDQVVATMDGATNAVTFLSDVWKDTVPIMYFEGNVEDNGLGYAILSERRIDGGDLTHSFSINTSTGAIEIYLLGQTLGLAGLVSVNTMTFPQRVKVLAGINSVTDKIFVLYQFEDGATYYEESGYDFDDTVSASDYPCAIGKSSYSSAYWFLGDFAHFAIGNHSAVSKILFDGDSLTAGEGLTAPYYYPSQIRAFFGRRLKLIQNDNFGVSGAKVAEMDAAAATGIDLEIGAGSDILVAMCGVNDLGAGTDPNDIYDDIVTYCQNRVAAGAKVYYCTILPCGHVSVDEDDRAALNERIRNELVADTGIEGIIDLDGNAKIGLPASPNDTTYFQVDKVHLTAAGANVLAEAVYMAIADAVPEGVSNLSGDYIFCERTGDIVYDRSGNGNHGSWIGDLAGDISNTRYSESDLYEDFINGPGYATNGGIIVPSRIDTNFESTGVSATGGELQALGLLGHNLKIVNNPVLRLDNTGRMQLDGDPIADNDVTIYICAKPSTLTGGDYDNMVMTNGRFTLQRDVARNAWASHNNLWYPQYAAEDSFKLDVWNHVFIQRLAAGTTFFVGYDGVPPSQSGSANQDCGVPQGSVGDLYIGSEPFWETYPFYGDLQTVLFLQGAISEADKLAIWEGRFSDVEATILDGYTLSEVNGSKAYSRVKTIDPATLSGGYSWVFDDKARPDFYMDGGDIWSDNGDPDNHEAFVFVPFDGDGDAVLTDGDTLAGYKWESTNPAGNWHNGGLNQYQNYEEAVLIAADIDYRLFFMDGTARKLSYYSRQYDYGCEHYAWSDDTEGQWKNFLLYSTPITEYKTQKAILSFLGRNIAECYYGYTYDQTVSDPALTEHGDISNPIIHDSIRHVVMKEDKSFNYILNPTDFQLQEDGITASVLTGADGDAMLVYPYHYRYYSKSGNVETLIVSPYAIPGLEAVNKYGYGIYGGYLDGTKLRSISGVRRTTNKYITEFRTYAANKGSGWCQKSDEAWTAVVFLALIDIMSFNSQAEISAGATNASSTDWNNYNAYNPVVDTGLIDSLGNFTGGIPFSVANFVGGTLPLNSQAACWRGIEHIFGDVWEFVDGLNIHNSAANGARAYSCKNPAQFASDTDSNYQLVGNIAETDGYVKKLLGGTILPLEVGGGSSTYMCDYHYSYYDNDPNSGWRVVLWGGTLNYGAKAGLLCAHCSNSSSNRSANLGARLCCKLS